MNRKLAKNTIYMYVITVVKMIFPLITLPYLTRVLTVDGYGVVTYVKTFMSYVQLVLDFGFLLSATKDIALFHNERDERAIANVVGDTIVEKLILALFSSIAMMIIICHIPILRQNQLFVWLYFVACVMTIFIPDFLYRGIERMEYVAIPYASAKVVVLVLTFVLVRGDTDILYIAILEIIGNVVAAIISMLIVRCFNIKISFSTCKKWIDDLKKSGVYFISNFATTFFGALTTVVVGIYLSTTQVAYWGICMQIVSAAKAMYTPVCNSLYPHMVVERDISIIKRMSWLMSIPIILGSIVVLIWGEDVAVLIGGSDYAISGYILKYLLPVLVISFFSMLYGWPVLGAIGKEKETMITTVISAFVQILGIVFLMEIDKFELVLLAVCCSLSEIVLFLSRYLFYLKYKCEFLKKA